MGKVRFEAWACHYFNPQLRIEICRTYGWVPRSFRSNIMLQSWILFSNEIRSVPHIMALILLLNLGRISKGYSVTRAFMVNPQKGPFSKKYTCFFHLMVFRRGNWKLLSDNLVMVYLNMKILTRNRRIWKRKNDNMILEGNAESLWQSLENVEISSSLREKI